MASKKNKNILITVPWSKHGPAGAEHSVMLRVNKLTKTFDIKVVVISFWNTNSKDVDKYFPNEIETEVINVSRARYAILKLAQAIHRFKPDIIVANVLFICSITIIAKWLSLVSCKLVSVNRGMDLSQNIFRFHAWFSGKFSDKVIVVSKGLKSDLASTLNINKNKIKVVYNPFDLAGMQKQATEMINLSIISGHVPLLVYVGRIVTSPKAVNVLLRSFVIASKNQEMNLMIIGDGKDRKEMENLSKELKIDNNVHWLGWKDNPLPYIKKADVLVLSSDFEGLPRVVVEALAVGTQVASTDCPSGPAEILQNGTLGSLSPVGDPEELAEGIKERIENPIDPDKLKKRAGDFSIEKSANKFIGVINKII